MSGSRDSFRDTKKRSEEDERRDNRVEIVKRSRQWVTVGSDGESDEEEDSNSNTHLNNKKENRGEDDSSSSSDSEIVQRDRHKKSKKKSSHSSKHKKDKKEKKHKHEHKSSKSKSKDDRKDSHNSTEKRSVVDQDKFGKYGIIREDCYYSKQREFEAYLTEVKGMPGAMGQSKREIMILFKDFIEDYNTATMPHTKYYNYERWEMEEYQRQKEMTSRQMHEEKELDGFNDEYERRIELKRAKDAHESKQFEVVKRKMAGNTSLREGMRRQEEYKTELQLAFKQGDMVKVKKIEKLLAPDEEGPAVKHPWA